MSSSSGAQQPPVGAEEVALFAAPGRLGERTERPLQLVKRQQGGGGGWRTCIEETRFKLSGSVCPVTSVKSSMLYLPAQSRRVHLGQPSALRLSIGGVCARTDT
jgi:hypothetical protein